MSHSPRQSCELTRARCLASSLELFHVSAHRGTRQHGRDPLSSSSTLLSAFGVNSKTAPGALQRTGFHSTVCCSHLGHVMGPCVERGHWYAGVSSRFCGIPQWGWKGGHWKTRLHLLDSPISHFVFLTTNVRLRGHPIQQITGSGWRVLSNKTSFLDSPSPG